MSMDERQLFNTIFLTQKHEISFKQQQYTFNIFYNLKPRITISYFEQIIGLQNRCQIINTQLVENAFRRINNLA